MTKTALKRSKRQDKRTRRKEFAIQIAGFPKNHLTIPEK
jgi:hypothetical protein